MNERDWRELDRRLDDAIDALNDERAPEPALDDDEQALLDTLHAVRRLREPADPDAEFEDELVRHVLAGVESPALVSFPNGVADRQPTRVRPIEMSRWRRSRLLLGQIAAVLRVVGVYVLAGMLAGAVVGGLGGRVVMRISGYLYQRDHPGQVVLTESSGEPVGQISLEGTLSLIMQATGFSMLIGLVLLVVMPWLPRRPLARTMVFGVLVTAMVGPIIFSGDNRDMRLFGPALLNVVMFMLLIMGLGVITILLAQRLQQAVNGSGGGRIRRTSRFVLRIGVVPLGALGLLAGGVMILTLGVAEPIGALVNPSVETLVIVPLAIFGLLLLPALRIALALSGRWSVLAAVRDDRVARYLTAAIGLVVAIGLSATLVAVTRIVVG